MLLDLTITSHACFVHSHHEVSCLAEISWISDYVSEKFVVEGICRAARAVHQFDIITLATELYSVTGGLNTNRHVYIHKLLRNEWHKGIQTYCGMALSTFLYIHSISGPKAFITYVCGHKYGLTRRRLGV